MGVCRVQDISFIEPQSIEGFWDEKITYTIAVPGHAFPLGGSIKVDMRYMPLLKGLFAETMKVQLIETHSIYPRSGFQGRMQRTRESIVVEDVAKFKEFEDNFDLENDDQWRRISHSIVIPKFLGKCRPTSRSSILEVIHSLKLSIRLRNPNGKYSEISAVFHLNLCPTSGLGIDQSCQSNIFVRIQPPPAYTDYIRDQPYFDSVSPSVSRASSSSDLSCPFDTLGEYPSWPASLEDISRVPCYEEAVLSGTSGNEYSPLYSV
ncbi:CreD protein [Penicillium malachiteum]|nr:CreD protein [Penicillium malachiteum]